MADTVTLTARYIFPVAGPPLERGLVTIAGDQIVAVEPQGALTAHFDVGNAAIVPGFVNAHTHLDLTGARSQTPPTPAFTDWLKQVIAFRGRRSRYRVERHIQAGIRECLRFGTTLIGDIAHEGQSTDQLLTAPLRSVVFRELIGLSAERFAATYEGYQWWRRAFPVSGTCRPGVSPHAPYSVNEFLYFIASIAGLPFATHLAESADEKELLEHHGGPFVPFLESLGVGQPESMAPSHDWIIERGGRAPVALFAHCNYLLTTAVIPANGTIVFCPRTHAAFGHPPHPFREFLARGVRVALGTDSLASNPDLSLLAEARFVHARHPDFPGEALLRMATLSGAEALGFADVTGSLFPGKSVDLAIVGLPPHDAADPHELLFASDLPVLATVFRGQRVIVNASVTPALANLPLPTVALP